MPQLTIKDNKFFYDNKEMRIISGSIHYFRVMPEYWRDRLEKLKACGFNTVETYTAWNIHEPQEEKFCFEGIADVEKFIQIADELGLYVIVRPSPFICAEWEFGGLPAWLLKDKNMRLRCFYKPYLEKIDKYYDVLMKKLRPLLSTNGGNIIAMQIENEYGSYGNDKEYLKYLKEALIQRGIDVPLFTSDGPDDVMLQGGTLEDVYKTGNFGSRAKINFDKIKEYEKQGPPMCMEFWNGWFDHWEEKHHLRDAEDAAKVFEEMLELGGSVNFYMFHGGTNFDFYNGANFSDKYEPTITSYDYDALLTEDGQITEKYKQVKAIISKYVEIPNVNLSTSIKRKAYGSVNLTEKTSLFENINNISSSIYSQYPQSMEEIGQNYGFILYRTEVKGPRKECKLSFMDMHDRAQIFINGEIKGIIYRNDEKQEIILDFDDEINSLDILVENMGRINYGPYLKDYKGITENVNLDYQFHYGWEIYPLSLDNINKLIYSKLDDEINNNLPMFYKGNFNVDKLGDTFIMMEGWNKGVVFINGFNIGRYWEKGPQKTLYVPAPILKKGENEVVIFELHGTDVKKVSFLDKPILG